MPTLKVSATCPSCGGPFEFIEGANVARCPFCNLPLLFQSPNSILSYYLQPKQNSRQIPFLVDRFRKEKKESLSRRVDEIKLYYLPYWRFTSEVFYAILVQPFLVPLEEDKETEILTKDWDINFPAHISNDLALATLGMRPEWLKLRLLTDRSLLKEGEVLNLELNSSPAKEKALKSLQLFMENKKSSEEELVLKLLGETLSLIYSPLWVVNFVAGEGKHYQIIDGITGRTLKQSPGYFELNQNKSREAQELSPPKIVPHRCPNCGWDLPVTPFHLVFPCDNCERIWKISESNYLPVKGEIAKTKENQTTISRKPVGYYPFWVFETRPEKEKTFSVEKLVELFPSEIGWFKVENKSRPFLFYVPAFKINNLNKIPSLSLALTRTQPNLEKEVWQKVKLVGAVRSEEDAQKIAEILWISLISSKMNLSFEEWKGTVFENGKIIWYPYYEEGNFLQDAVTGYTFQRIKSPA
jgi:hypothetical protein